MRLVVWLVVVLAACKGSSRTEPPADWKPIEALATMPPSAGDATELLRAINVAKQHGDAWRDGKLDHVEEAVTALKAWATAKGALPPITSPLQVGVVALQTFSVGQAAIDFAKTDADLDAPDYLGAKLVTEGRSLLEAQIGTTLVEHTAHRRKELGAPAKTPPKLDLVRVLAAEALHARASSDFAMTAEGRKELEAAAKDMAEHEREVPAGFNLQPTEAHIRGRKAFWLAALKGAQRGESVETTLARLQSAVDAAPGIIKGEVSVVPNVAKMMSESYASLANEPAQ